MPEKIETDQLTDDRPAYEVPRALRLDSQHRAAGGVTLRRRQRRCSRVHCRPHRQHVQ